MSTPELPRTDSIRELADFWDTHDLVDFNEELEEITEPVFEREKTVLLHLGPGEAEAVRRMAESQGIDDADLIHRRITVGGASGPVPDAG